MVFRRGLGKMQFLEEDCEKMYFSKEDLEKCSFQKRIRKNAVSKRGLGKYSF